jgi:uncharacterized protein YggU (UPF0235/DUF167 family)
MIEPVRLEIHVRPSAAKTVVGGTHDGALVVRVKDRPEQGRATEAALDAIAEALGIPRRQVSLVHGTKSRRKLIDIGGLPDAAVQQRIAELLAPSDS